MLSGETEVQGQLAEVVSLQRQALRDDKAGETETAEALYRRALALHEQTLGPDHPEIMQSLGCLAFFYGRHDRHADAEPLIRRGLLILEAKPGPKHRGILQTLDALASQSRGKSHPDDAERYYRQVISARQCLLGLDHPRTTKSIAALDEVLEAKRNPQAEAERVAKVKAKVAATRAMFARTTFGADRESGCEEK